MLADVTVTAEPSEQETAYAKSALPTCPPVGCTSQEIVASGAVLQSTEHKSPTIVIGLLMRKDGVD